MNYFETWYSYRQTNVRNGELQLYLGCFHCWRNWGNSWLAQWKRNNVRHRLVMSKIIREIIMYGCIATAS